MARITHATALPGNQHGFHSSSLSDMMLNRPFFPVGWENLILIS